MPMRGLTRHHSRIRRANRNIFLFFCCNLTLLRFQMKGKRPNDNAPFVSSEFFNELTRQWRQEAEVTAAHLSAYSILRMSYLSLPSRNLSYPPRSFQQFTSPMFGNIDDTDTHLIFPFSPALWKNSAIRTFLTRASLFRKTPPLWSEFRPHPLFK
jgi:hypothetical protein